MLAFYEYAKSKPKLQVFLPDNKRTQRPEREYIFNIIRNIISHFINSKIEEVYRKRLSEAVFENGLNIEIREDILKEIMSAKYESSWYWLLKTIKNLKEEQFTCFKSQTANILEKEKKASSSQLEKYRGSGRRKSRIKHQWSKEN